MPNPNIPNRSLHPSTSYEMTIENIAGNMRIGSLADLGSLRQNGYVIDRVFNDAEFD
jgi:hypothetical protein